MYVNEYFLAGAAEFSKIPRSVQRDESTDHAATKPDAGDPLGWHTHLFRRAAGQQLYVLSEHCPVAPGHLPGHAKLLSPQPGQNPHQGNPTG